MSEISRLETRAVDIARAHIEAWSNHDFEQARKNLARDVHVTVTTTQPTMSATDTFGLEKYMDGLIKFAQAVEPGSARIIGSVGDEHNALIMLSVKAALGPGGAKLDVPAARLYFLDDNGKIKTEQVIFYAAPNLTPQNNIKSDHELFLDQSYYLNAPPETVFQALTDPKILVKWFLAKAYVDPREGGDYDFDWLGGFHQSGKITRFEKDKAVSFSWNRNTIAAFETLKKGRGTLLKLHHGRFKDPEPFATASSRWGYFLTNMKSVLDHGIDLRSKDDS
ncbi:SRPBCC domain-containing protein [Candidatus Bathyarchaeota archaeon]|nr:SRPBCC domain-containing protein [Candidatus Bathyarchaeota archaeon]